jgi:two-component system response regulator RegA
VPDQTTPKSDLVSSTELVGNDHRPSLLLVDDSDGFRQRLERALADRGYDVYVASNYDEALSLAREEMPDRAVIDLRMPGRSGLELLRDLKELDDSIEVVLLTGFGSIPTTVDAVRLGAVNVLTKPADADDVLAGFERAGADMEHAPTPNENVPSLARAEWEHIHRILADCGGNISEAARRLGIHRRSLQRKLRKYAPD